MSHPTMGWSHKDPADVLDYEIVWADVLASGETISTSNWAITPSTANMLTSATTSISGSKTKTWLSAGLTGTIYSVKNTITTSGSRTLERTVTIPVVEI